MKEACTIILWRGTSINERIMPPYYKLGAATGVRSGGGRPPPPRAPEQSSSKYFCRFELIV